MKEIALVTGGAGFIGSHIVDALIDRELDVIVVDDESAESNEQFYKNVKKFLSFFDYFQILRRYLQNLGIFDLCMERVC